MKRILSIILCLLILVTCLTSLCACGNAELKSCAKAIVKEHYDSAFYSDMRVTVTSVVETTSFGAYWGVYGTVTAKNEHGKKCSAEWNLYFHEDLELAYTIFRNLEEID